MCWLVPRLFHKLAMGDLWPEWDPYLFPEVHHHPAGIPRSVVTPRIYSPLTIFYPNPNSPISLYHSPDAPPERHEAPLLPFWALGGMVGGMTEAENEALLRSCVERLGEQFEAVQILVSWNEDGLSKMRKMGAGNWYARQGMAHEFINSDIAQENAHQIAEKLNPPDEGEDWKATP